MAIIVELPSELEQRLRASNSNLEADAREAMLIELYRKDQLTRYELSQALQLNRFEVDALIKEHQVSEDLPTLEQLENDYRVLKRLLDN
jgi:hypothetical protein